MATLQTDLNVGRILAAYGGVFVAGSLAWAMVMDTLRPDRWDVIGAVVSPAGRCRSHVRNSFYLIG